VAPVRTRGVRGGKGGEDGSRRNHFAVCPP
jgi:hypothetical protein